LSRSAKTERPILGGALLSPWALAAVLVLVLNDHWWKRAWPGLVTGKLSDFAGLIFFPLLLQALWELGQATLRRPWRPSLRVLWVAIAATGVGFALVQLWPPAGTAYRVGLGYLQWPLLSLARWEWRPPVEVALVQDPTDLVALPALGIAAWIGRRRMD
jgi:hypothetical protein